MSKHVSLSTSNHYAMSARANALWFRGYPMAAGSLDEIAEVIELLATKPEFAIVLGDLTPFAHEEQAAGRDIMRRKKDRPDQPATFMDRPTRLFPVDIDSYRLQDPARLANDLDAVVEEIVREILPEEFHDATVFYAASGSCGYVPGIAKFHLFFELETPATIAAMRHWVQTLALAVDLSIYQPHGLIFTAHAERDAGIADPMPRRFGWLYGAQDRVSLGELPAPPVYTQFPGSTAGSTTGSITPGGHLPDAGGLWEALLAVGDGPGLQGFHAPLRRAAWLYAADSLATGQRDDPAMIRIMAETVMAAPSQDGRNPSRADATYLRQLITSAFEALQAEAAMAAAQPVAPRPDDDEALAQMEVSLDV